MEGIKFDEVFDKYYMISLPEAAKRRTKALTQLENAGIDLKKVEVVDAYRGADIEWTKENENAATEGWNANAKALGIKTLELVKDAKEKNYKNIFIFEDDTMIVETFTQLFTYFWTRLPKLWDFVHLNASHIQPSRYYAPYINQISYAWCCQAYGISWEVYDRYIEKLEKLDRPIDQCTAEIHFEGRNSYCPPVNIVYHEPNNFSTLREEVVYY